MSRKNGSKSSFPSGTGEVWTTRVCTTLSVTTEGPTRCAASTIAVRRVRSTFPGAFSAIDSAAVAADTWPWGPDTTRFWPRVPTRSAARSRRPKRIPAARVPRGHLLAPREEGEFSSGDDIQRLLGNPSHPGIPNPHQVETVRRSGRCGGPAIPRFERGFHRARAGPALRLANDRGHDPANHSVQEPVRFDVEAQPPAAPGPPRARDAAERATVLASLLRERREIVRAEERPGRLVERRDPRANRARPGVTPPDRDDPRLDDVSVGAPHRVEPRVEFRLDLLHLDDPDVAGKDAVERQPEPLRREPRRELHARDLPRGVASRVGPPRARDPDRAVRQALERGLDFSLNRSMRPLHLPTVELRAVVLDDQAVRRLPAVRRHEAATRPMPLPPRSPPSRPSPRWPEARFAAGRPAGSRGRGARLRTILRPEASCPGTGGARRPDSAPGPPRRDRDGARGRGAPGAAAPPRGARSGSERGRAGRSRWEEGGAAAGAESGTRAATAPRRRERSAPPSGGGRGARAAGARSGPRPLQSPASDGPREARVPERR